MPHKYFLLRQLTSCVVCILCVFVLALAAVPAFADDFDFVPNRQKAWAAPKAAALVLSKDALIAKAATRSAVTKKQLRLRKQAKRRRMLKRKLNKLKADRFCLAQSGSGRCTVTAVAMMLKRAAFFNNKAKLSRKINEQSVAAKSWTYAGLQNHFSAFGYTVSFQSISSQNRWAALRKLLKEHPEGIAAYDPGVPHAVLLSDYDKKTGTFYCADPAPNNGGSRIKLARSWNASVRGSQEAAIAGFSYAWIIER